MPTRIEALLTLPLLLALSGCPVWGNDRAGGGSDGCATDGDCSVGFVCTESTGVCSMAPTCTTDASCSPGSVCDFRGTCVPQASGECRTNDDCNGGMVCVENTCRATGAETCQFDLECAAGMQCVDNACVNSCTSAAQCGSGESCVSGRCVTDTDECTTSSQCSGSESCVDGRCLPPCSSGGNCSDSQDACDADGFCHPDWHPQVFCDANDDCNPGSTCDIPAGICRVACTASSPLVTNYTPNASCTGANADCACQTADVQFPTCGLTTAPGDDDFCRTAAEGMSDCATESDCSGGQHCVNGACE